MEGQISTGLVLVSGYARKMKRTAFAQLSDAIKSGIVTSNEVAFKVGQLNKFLFEVLVGQLRLDKHDVVRIRVGYTLENGVLNWEYDTIQIEIWKFSQEASEQAVTALKTLLEEADFLRDLELEVEKAGVTPLGEEVYKIRHGEEDVGAIKVIKTNGTILVMGAIRDPPRLIRVTMPGDVDVQDMIASILARSTKARPEEAERVISEILKEIQ